MGLIVWFVLAVTVAAVARRVLPGRDPYPSGWTTPLFGVAGFVLAVISCWPTVGTAGELGWWLLMPAAGGLMVVVVDRVALEITAPDKLGDD